MKLQASKMPITFLISCTQSISTLIVVKNLPSAIGLNNGVSLCCTVTLCWTLTWSPHMSWPLTFSPLASSHTQESLCKNEGFKRPQRRFTRIDPCGPWLIIPKSDAIFLEFTPQLSAESLWSELCMSGPKGTTTHALSLVPVIHSPSRSVQKVQASALARFPACVDWFCLCQAIHLSLFWIKLPKWNKMVWFSDCFLYSLEQ